MTLGCVAHFISICFLECLFDNLFALYTFGFILSVGIIRFSVLEKDIYTSHLMLNILKEPQTVAELCKCECVHSCFPFTHISRCT